MPELPEVEEARRTVEENCAGRVILSATVADDDKVIHGVSSSDLASTLIGRTLVSAKRKGKHFWFELDKRPWPLLHLGMAGAVLIRGYKNVRYKRGVDSNEEWPPKYFKLLLEFEGGVQFAFVDSRRFARIRLQQDPLEEEPVASLGPDAFLELPEPVDFMSSLRKRTRPLKAVLLDQAFLSGIGNWIADEVLYQACVHPEHPSHILTDEECLKLYNSISEVIKLAVCVRADSSEFPDYWLFHKRWSKKPGDMGGHPIRFITVGGRTSAFVPFIQKLPEIAMIESKSRKKKKVTFLEEEAEEEERGNVSSSKTENEEIVRPVKQNNTEEDDLLADMKFGKRAPRSKKIDPVKQERALKVELKIGGESVVEGSNWVRRSARVSKPVQKLNYSLPAVVKSSVRTAKNLGSVVNG